jgi:molybdopterin-containing oxidoreductase family iron-sulfur binding subunit
MQQRSNNADSSGEQFVPLDQLRPPVRVDIEAVRQKLAGARGREYWRSLEEVAETEEFQKYLEREFPHQAPRDMAPLSRREFVRVMGATLALAGVGGCGYQRAEKIVPYIEQPEQLVPGKPLYYATAYERGGYAIGILGESRMGRPVKLEGNPEHPASQGATDIFAQASLLQLYDPDRSQAVRSFGNSTTWESFVGALNTRMRALRGTRGQGLRILTGAVTSPTLASQIRRVLQALPQAQVHYHEPVGRDNVLAGARLAFGQEANPVYNFAAAKIIFSLDCNFLHEEPGSVRYARDFARGRLVRDGRTDMNRLYVVESTPSITGAKADHRITLKPTLIEAVGRAVAAGVGAGGGGATAAPEGVPQEWLQALVSDLQANRGASLVISGANQPPAVHALAHAINGALGNIGKTVTFTDPLEVFFGDPATSLKRLTDDMNAGRVDTLIILGANPVYTAPADVPFRAALEKLSNAAPGQTPEKLTVHLGLYDDETGVRCQWHVPQSHYLEAWSDARAYDGTVSIVQPLITPLYESRSAHEMLDVLVNGEDRPGYEIVREFWRNRLQAANFDQVWHQCLIRGTVPNSKAPARTLAPRATAAAGPAGPAAPAAAPQGREIALRPDSPIWDGRFANNGWLQELPKHISQLTWDNGAYISPRTAEQQGLRNGDVVDLQYRDARTRAAVWIVPGHPDGSVTLTLGYGQERAGRVGTGMGFDAYALRSSDPAWFGPGLQMTKTGETYQLVGAQHHFSMEGRGLVKTGTPDELGPHPAFMHGEAHLPEGPLPSLFPNEWPSDRIPVEGSKVPIWEGKGLAKGPVPQQDVPQWGMVIDLNACIGCNACTIGCQAENNIATVGKEQVANSREMHWIRIDQYYLGGVDNPAETVFQPVPCMHCEKAPCEPVCPVEATSHSAEGINEMTYNRCIGTRYCSNNCPYKVRRFNYFQYSEMKTGTYQLMRNPDVTVRARGVMEKCTYCIQRVKEARIEAEKEERPIRDGDVLTACQQVCPTNAIVFGNVNDTKSNNGKGSRVRQLKALPINYELLPELNTRPRTSYLANMRNPHPSLKRPEAALREEHGGAVGEHDAGAAGHNAPEHTTPEHTPSPSGPAQGSQEGH